MSILRCPGCDTEYYDTELNCPMCGQPSRPEPAQADPGARPTDQPGPLRTPRRRDLSGALTAAAMVTLVVGMRAVIGFTHARSQRQRQVLIALQDAYHGAIDAKLRSMAMMPNFPFPTYTQTGDGSAAVLGQWQRAADHPQARRLRGEVRRLTAGAAEATRGRTQSATPAVVCPLQSAAGSERAEVAALAPALRTRRATRSSACRHTSVVRATAAGWDGTQITG